MELSNLQGQLKVAIRKHQITVSKMKSDPQNVLLKKQLKEIQVEIVNINNKQKLVIANLKKELEGQSNRQTPKINKTVSTTLSSAVSENQAKATKLVVTTTDNKQSISVNTGIQSHGLSFRVEKPSVTTTVVTLPAVPTAAQKIINQVVPTIVAAANSAANLKATVLFPSLTAGVTANLLNKVAISSTPNQTGSSTLFSSLLVVPSPPHNSRPQTSDNVTPSNTTTSTTTSASFVLKLGSPIRVPQYPPPNCRTGSLSSSTSTSTVDSCGTVVTAIENVHVKKEKKLQPILPTCDIPLKSNLKTIPKVKTEDNSKMNFMTALGLINRDVLNELQSKRGERKRRTTANPQFSNAALEEKRKNAAAILSAVTASNTYTKTTKKSRGKARLNTSPIQSPPPTPPPTTMPRTENGANIYISRNGSSLVITNTTTQCNSLENLPVGAHHVVVKTELASSPISTVDDNAPLNCSKKAIPQLPAKPNVINSKPVSSKGENNGGFSSEAEALIKTAPKNHILNGCLKSVLNKNGGILSEVVLCGICHLRLGAGSGDMLACIGCKRPYHTRCAAKVVPHIIDGNVVNKNAHWKCPKCVIPISASTISSPSSTAIALTVPVKTSFTHHQPWKKDPPVTTVNNTEKIAKDEEKQRLLKRSRELNEEVTKLREKRQRLSEQHAATFQHQAELAANKKRTEEKLTQMRETVNMVRSRSS